MADVDDGRLEVVAQEKAFTSLGSELATRGEIGTAKLAELVTVVEAQVAVARRLGVAQIRAVATAAVRRAANGRRLARELAERTGTEIEILSAGEEARLAFCGAVGMLQQPPTGLVGVIDIGGGSCELVVGEPGAAPTWWESVALGSSSVTDRWLHSDPPHPLELSTALDHVRAAVAGLSPPRPASALAVGGSATSLGRVAGCVLDGPAFARALSLLGSEPAARLGQRIGVGPQRIRLLPAALLLLEAMAARLEAPLMVSSGGIREGLLLELAIR